MIKWGKVKEPSAVLSWREDVTAAKELLYPKEVIRRLRMNQIRINVRGFFMMPDTECRRNKMRPTMNDSNNIGTRTRTSEKGVNHV